MKVRSILAALAIIAGCQGETGTIQVVLVTAPGSDVLDQVSRARLTLDNPLTVVEATRTPGGQLTLDIDVVAEGTAGTLTLEGFDDTDQLIAYGTTAPLPVAAFEGLVKLYVAAPMSIAAAAVELATPRSAMAQSLLSFGVVWAGGRNASGEPTTDMVIYNVYDHDFQVGLDMPEARHDMAAMAGTNGVVYLVGGVTADGVDSEKSWTFDTNAPPAGQYSPMDSNVSLARSGSSAAPVDIEVFLVTGDPVALVDGITRRVSPHDSAMALAGTATTVTVNGTPNTLFAGLGAGVSGATLFVGNNFIELNAPPEASRTEHDAVLLPDGTILIVGGRTLSDLTTSALRYDPTTREMTVLADFLATARVNAAVATTSDYVIVAGGADASGTPIDDVEVFETNTLGRVATLPLQIPRTEALAAPLANGQIVIAGGLDASGAPTAILELFTPQP